MAAAADLLAAFSRGGALADGAGWRYVGLEALTFYQFCCFEKACCRAGDFDNLPVPWWFCKDMLHLRTFSLSCFNFYFWLCNRQLGFPCHLHFAVGEMFLQY